MLKLSTSDFAHRSPECYPGRGRGGELELAHTCGGITGADDPTWCQGGPWGWAGFFSNISVWRQKNPKYLAMRHGDCQTFNCNFGNVSSMSPPTIVQSLFAILQILSNNPQSCQFDPLKNRRGIGGAPRTKRRPLFCPTMIFSYFYLNKFGLVRFGDFHSNISAKTSWQKTWRFIDAFHVSSSFSWNFLSFDISVTWTLCRDLWRACWPADADTFTRWSIIRRYEGASCLSMFIVRESLGSCSSAHICDDVQVSVHRTLEDSKVMTAIQILAKKMCEADPSTILKVHSPDRSDDYSQTCRV